APVVPVPVAPVTGALTAARAPFSEDQARRFQEQWAAHLKIQVQESNTLGMKLVLCPPGEFDMGSSEEDFQRHVQKFGKYFGDAPSRRPAGEGPVHKVRITRPFLIGATEVTVGQFRRFVAEQQFKTDAEKNGKGGTGLVE